ncbi:type II secretion system minor pseudopilin GspH [Oxalobacteraceae bacterium]|nr:type II secretion system minor pseudopilin GspH [Oxalobacteraceae bacterium]
MRAARHRGFTLIELLVVMVILGVTLGLVSLKAMPSQKQSLQQEAQRVALLLQLARDEAIVRNRMIAFEADQEGYRFLVRNDKQWQPLAQDDMLRARPFKSAPITLLLDPPAPLSDSGMRITFGREPVDKPFVLTFVNGGDSVAIRADGIGHFSVD